MYLQLMFILFPCYSVILDCPNVVVSSKELNVLFIIEKLCLRAALLEIVVYVDCESIQHVMVMVSQIKMIHLPRVKLRAFESSA